MKSNGIGKRLATFKSRLKRYGFDNGITSFRQMGAKYWKKMSTSQKFSYISTMIAITSDNENNDPHIGDEHFQSTYIGQVRSYIEFVASITSDFYKERDKRERGWALAIDFPDSLLRKIDKPSGSYRYSKLLQRDATYQINPDLEVSRARRYTDVECTDKDEIIRYQGKPQPLPIHPEAQQLIFNQLDTLWKGISSLMAMDLEQQNELIVQGLAPNTNSGYPFFTTQTKDNLNKMFWSWLQDFCPTVYAKHKNNSPLLFCGVIFDAINDCEKRKWYEPSVNFYRTQIDKVRSVFGGTILLKALGALVHAGKKLGYTEEVHAELNLPVVDHWDKQLVSYGGLPIMAQLDWSVMFKDICDRLPKIKEGIVQETSADEMRSLFHSNVGRPVILDVVGEDLEAYDTSIIYEDLTFLENHKNLGFIMKFLLHWLQHSEVWVGHLRIFDIFFKSGHPWTSDIGSFNHINLAFVTRDYIRDKGRDCNLFAFTVLSDDSLFWWEGYDIDLAIECAEKYGYKIKKEQSFIYSRDKMVFFLKVGCGYIFSDADISYCGDFMSRYYKLCHSEREILTVDGLVKGHLIGVQKVTEDPEIDAYLYKLASFGEPGLPVVMEILRLGKDVALVRTAIKVIMGMSEESRYERYREDVQLGFRVNWLANLPVQGLLNPKFSRA